MSITLEKLSLLGSLAPLRLKTDIVGSPQDNGFAGKLDKALGNGEPIVSSATDKARELAESLTLQMLQSSLSLGGDALSNSSVSSRSTLIPSANALLQAYSANIPVSGESSSPAVPSPPPETLKNVSAATLAGSSLIARSGSDWLDPIIAKASQKYGVEVGLIKAVIKAESDFKPQAISHAGARGLMQLMPATARSLGVSDSFDPEQNVMGGTRFLKDMLQRYNGDVDSALAAYNWGPGNVDKRPDRLPRETRDYLVRVTQLYASYSS